jgi:hypothetical protein
VRDAFVILNTKMVSTSTRMLDDYEVMQCIDSALDKFGPGIKYTVYWRMVVLNQAPSEGIIANPEGFATALKSIFGNSAKQIEQAIIDEIKSRVGNEYSNSLPTLISEVRREKLLVSNVL